MVFHSIGAKVQTATEIFRQHGLTPLRKILTPTLFASVRPKQSPPKTILVPEVVFWLMASVTLSGSSMAGVVSGFWASLRAAYPSLPMKTVTEEAFCKARGKLPLLFFLRLFKAVIAGFLRNYNQRWRWRGHRLLGIDGTEVTLPKDPHLRKRFPSPSNQHGSCAAAQARLVGLAGLADGLCYAFQWTSLKISEQACAKRLARFLAPGDLLLADRNFPSLAIFAALLARGAGFLFRLPAKRYDQYKRLVTPSQRVEEWYLELPLPLKLRKQFPWLPKCLKVRVLAYQRKGFRVSWLITSMLDTKIYPYEELVNLYHQRWRHETCHREWKHTLQLNNLRSHKASELLKEVLVQLTINNVLRWIQAQAAPANLRPVDLQFLQTKRLVFANVCVMTVVPVCLLPQLYRELLVQVGRCRIRVRPNRSHPRPWDTRARNNGRGELARPARLTQQTTMTEKTS
jgi:hypothetical protein